MTRGPPGYGPLGPGRSSPSAYADRRVGCRCLLCPRHRPGGARAGATVTPIRRAVITVATIVVVCLGVAGAPTAAAESADVAPLNVEVVHDEAFNEVVERVETRDRSTDRRVGKEWVNTCK